MRKHRSFAVLILALVLIPDFMLSCKWEDHESVIMAYYVPGKEYHKGELQLDKLTHIIYSFAKVTDGEMSFMHKSMGEKLKLLVEERDSLNSTGEKAGARALKVMVACGGWGADGFSDAAYNEESRNKFIASAVKLVREYDLDGIDIDWEYPGIPAAGTKARPEDKQNFTLLLKGLREEMDKLERDQTISFAAAGWKPYFNNIELNEVLKYADYMNIMTYDQVIFSSPFTGHHTAFGMIRRKDIEGTPFGESIKEREEGSVSDDGFVFEIQSVERIVDFLLNQGADPSRLVVGAAFYGRGWKGVGPGNNGLYQPNGGSWAGWLGYRVIRERHENKNGFVRYWDPVAKAPYLYNAADSLFITYDDTVSVGLKTRYALDMGLGGIMFWQLGNDAREGMSLVDAIYDESKQ